MKVIFALLLIASCSRVKTKNDCVSDCKSRGAEYAGVIPDGKTHDSGWGTTDVCQCR